MSLRVLFGFLLLSMWCGADDSLAITHLKRAKDQLVTWKKRFVTMRVQSELVAIADSNILLREAGVEHSVSRHDWVWEDSGRFFDKALLYHDGDLESTSVRSADLTRYFATSFRPGSQEEDVPSQVAIYSSSPTVTSMRIMKQPFWFLWDSKTRTWLGQRLKSVTEAELAKDDLLQIDGEAIGFEGFTVKLAPQHNYLPVFGEIKKNGDERYEVTDFEEVETGFWFPKRGTIDAFVDDGKLSSRWKITSVELNQEYPAELFVPPMGNGTRVINTITGKQYWHGGKTPAKTESSQAQPEPRTINPDPASATPETPVDWSWWLVGFGVVCVGLAIWIRR